MDEFIATATDLTKEDGRPLSGFCAKLSAQSQQKVGERDKKCKKITSIFHHFHHFHHFVGLSSFLRKVFSELCTKGQGRRSWPPASWALPALASMNSSGGKTGFYVCYKFVLFCCHFVFVDFCF